MDPLRPTRRCAAVALARECERDLVGDELVDPLGRESVEQARLGDPSCEVRITNGPLPVNNMKAFMVLRRPPKVPGITSR
jgi:hypothetical protein